MSNGLLPEYCNADTVIRDLTDLTGQLVISWIIDLRNEAPNPAILDYRL